MSYITKKEIINDICNKKHWDINESVAQDAVKDISNGKCKKYSTMHYKMVYCIIKSKAEQIKNPIERIAYIDCLRMNYAELCSDRFNKLLDIASMLLSGSCFGISILNDINNLEIIALNTVIITIFQLIKIIDLMFTKWGFYHMILIQLKSDLT